MGVNITNLTELIEKKKAIRDGALEDLVSGKTRLPGFDDEWIDSRIGQIFRKRGLPLDEFQEPDKTYLMILEHLLGLDILDFNELLKQKKLKELGTKSKGA